HHCGFRCRFQPWIDHRWLSLWLRWSETCDDKRVDRDGPLCWDDAQHVRAICQPGDTGASAKGCVARAAHDLERHAINLDCEATQRRVSDEDHVHLRASEAQRQGVGLITFAEDVAAAAGVAGIV